MQFKRDVVMKKISLLALVVSLSISSVANAGFVSLDWKVDGDEQATLHEETGVEWLKLSVTDGLSVQAVKSELGVGGLYEGWRLPTLYEVVEVYNYLWDTELGERESYSRDVVSSRAGGDAAFAIYDEIFGTTHNASNVNFQSIGLTQDPDNSAVYRTGFAVFHGNASTLRSVSYLQTSASDDVSGGVSSVAYGVFLVADGGATKTTQENMALTANNPNSTAYASSATSVPEPTSMAILGLGLLGLGAARMSKKSKV